jgi:hypothetical protein
MYHATVRLSLEPDRPFLGHTGLWWFAEKTVGAARWNVCLQLFRIVTFDTEQTFNVEVSGPRSF